MSEELLQRLGAQFFLREFSFSDAKYRKDGVGEYELGDHVLLLDRELMLFELKERKRPSEATEETERMWFKKQILREAITQFDGNVKRLKAAAIPVQNQAGHEITVEHQRLATIRKLVTYTHAPELPLACIGQRGYDSKRVGFAHIMPLAEYVQVVEILVTPAEIFEYLDFREALLTRHGLVHPGVSEKALVGQFIVNNPDKPPYEGFAVHVDDLDQDPRSFELLQFLSDYGDRIVYSVSNRGSSETDYYRVLAEVAKLNRTGVRLLQERLGRALSDVRADRRQVPMRVNGGTGCTFVVIPVPAEFFENRIVALANFTELGKYTMRTDRAVGISCAKDGDGFMIDWYFSEHAWEQRDDLEQMLEEANPFPDPKHRVIERYTDEQIG